MICLYPDGSLIKEENKNIYIYEKQINKNKKNITHQPLQLITGHSINTSFLSERKQVLRVA